MLDSIDVANLPDGADAYLGYTGGKWPTFNALVARFTNRADLLSMAIAADEDADGCDREAGDLAVTQIAVWVKRQLARGVHRPVVYASASNMGACLVSLSLAGIDRRDVRLLSAHYTHAPHICGPATCREPGCPPCDGTQWTDKARGAGAELIDESLLADGFFELPAPALRPKEEPMLYGTGKSPLAIPPGTRNLHLVTGEARKVTIEFHGIPTRVVVEVSWATGSEFVPVPDKVHAAMVDVGGHTGHVSLSCE